MTIIPKSRAMTIYRRQTGSVLRRFDQGRYCWYGLAHHYVGRTVPDLANVMAVYVERRRDCNSPYACLMCVTRI